MRLIKMTGGLGNQLFIYAFYLSMRRRFPNTRIDLSDMMHYHAHNGYELHRVFGLPQEEFCINQPLKKVLEFLFFKTIIERKQDLTTLEAFERSYAWPFVYFKGFFQSERYFKDVADEVRRLFTFPHQRANERSRRLREQILADPNAVSLHVRRGDYLLPQFWETVGRMCPLAYYEKALNEICQRVPSPHFYVFSDDLEWVCEHLHLENAVYIEGNTGDDSWQDMMLMSCCKHHIIPNSTFSWWAAWLNPHQDKIVVAPRCWFADRETPYIVPNEWIKIDNEP